MPADQLCYNKHHAPDAEHIFIFSFASSVLKTGWARQSLAPAEYQPMLRSAKLASLTGRQLNHFRVWDLFKRRDGLGQAQPGRVPNVRLTRGLCVDLSIGVVCHIVERGPQLLELGLRYRRSNH